MAVVPRTRAELAAAGYRFDGTSTCRGARCREELFWWVTPKNKVRMPFNADGTPHFATCVDEAQFRPPKRRGSAP